MGEGSITASCGCVVNNIENLVSVDFDDLDCDAVEGYIPAMTHVVYCKSCAEELNFRGSSITDTMFKLYG